MLIADFLMGIIDLLLVGNLIGKAIRKEVNRWTVIFGIALLIMGIYFDLVAIGEAIDISQSLSVQI